jgi:hypothetical protein
MLQLVNNEAIQGNTNIIFDLELVKRQSCGCITDD